MRKVANEKGSTLVWAMTIVMVMVILVAGALTLSKQYHTKTLHDSRARQAQLSARAAGDVIAKSLNKGFDNFNIPVTLVPKKWDAEGLDTNAIVEVSEVYLPEKMGTAKAKIVRVSEELLYIDCTAVYQEVEITERIYLQQKLKEGTTIYAWAVIKYDDELKEQVDIDEI